jgi:type II secretory pathway component PulF
MSTSTSSLIAFAEGINSAANRLIFRSFMGLQDRIKVYKQLGVLLSNQLPLEEAVAQMYVVLSRRDEELNPDSNYQQQLNKILAEQPRQVPAQMMQAILRELRPGNGMADAMVGWVTEQEVSIVRTGEENGDLPNAMRQCVFALLKRAELSKRLFGALFVPTLLMVGIYAALLANGLLLAPALIRLMPLEMWTGATHALIVFGLWVKSWTIVIVVATVLAVSWVMWSMPNLTGKPRDRLDKFAPWSIYRMFQGAVFLLNFSMMLSSGHPDDEALERLSQKTTPYLLERLTHARRGLARGLNIGQALHHAEHHFPDDDTIGLLRILAGRSGFTEALQDSIGDTLDQSMDAVVRLANFIRTMLILLGVGVLVWMFIGVYGMSQITHAMQHH